MIRISRSALPRYSAQPNGCFVRRGSPTNTAVRLPALPVRSSVGRAFRSSPPHLFLGCELPDLACSLVETRRALDLQPSRFLLRGTVRADGVRCLVRRDRFAIVDPGSVDRHPAAPSAPAL